MKTLLIVVMIATAASVAHADGVGLYAEQDVRLDDVHVRRIRDTSNGIVCYVAKGFMQGTGYSSSRGDTVAISCLKEIR